MEYAGYDLEVVVVNNVYVVVIIHFWHGSEENFKEFIVKSQASYGEGKVQLNNESATLFFVSCSRVFCTDFHQRRQGRMTRQERNCATERLCLVPDFYGLYKNMIIYRTNQD